MVYGIASQALENREENEKYEENFDATKHRQNHSDRQRYH